MEEKRFEASSMFAKKAKTQLSGQLDKFAGVSFPLTYNNSSSYHAHCYQEFVLPNEFQCILCNNPAGRSGKLNKTKSNMFDNMKYFLGVRKSGVMDITEQYEKIQLSENYDDFAPSFLLQLIAVRQKHKNVYKEMIEAQNQNDQ